MDIDQLFRDYGIVGGPQVVVSIHLRIDPSKDAMQLPA